jgi:type 1 glutamine amidotransferase/HEAT repeat protein
MRKWILGWLVAAVTAFGADTAVVLTGTPQERAAAAQALGYARDAAAVEPLAKAAQDGDRAVACAAAEALGAIGTEQAADALLRAWAGGAPAPLANGVLKCAEARLASGDTARARALYEACRDKGEAACKAAALLGLSALEPPAAAAARPTALEALRDDSALVRLKGIREAVRAADAAALPSLFAMAASPDEEGRAALLALSAMSAKETDGFLYGEMKKAGPERARAIRVLASRGRPELVQRLCDASLYAAAGVTAAAGDAFRACVRQETFAPALAFAFGPLDAAQREPLVSALASVAQQLPDQARVVREVGGQLAQADAAAKAEVLGLLAGLQTEGARDVLGAQAKSDDVELRKTAVRVLAKWSSPLAVAPLAAAAKGDADRSVKILATRGLLAWVQKSGVVEKSEKLSICASLAGVAERTEEKKAVYDCLRAVGGKEADALRKQLAEACGLTNAPEQVVAAVNAGGQAVGAFAADAGFNGGSVYAVQLEADVSDASDAAPEEVYQSCRFRDSAYTFDRLNPGQDYTLRLHFAETFHQRAGARIFDVFANGKPLLTDYDIVGKTGRRMKAATESFGVKADVAGQLVVEFKTKRDQALVNGLELLGAGSAREDTAKLEGERPREPQAPGPGQLSVLLLAGANNHNWQETTAALQAIFAGAPKFFVRVEESPWDMKPADLEGCDLIFNNWNTYGKDKREWTVEMKAAFMAWVKKGGGFFVLHAGGSMFYDWDEFQALTGGAWEKDTFHPHRQSFTVNIADKTHPVTRGMADFETFDEPWQRIANRNPKRRVLLTGLVSKENKGSGEPEPFAFVTEMGKGRCFNLVLGHDGRALSNAGCRTLVLRGAEWAATGDVK